MIANKIILTCYEKINQDKLELILNHQDYFAKQMKPESFDKFNFNILEKYEAKIKNGLTKVDYFQHDDIGRMYAIGSQSLQNFPKIIRGTLAKDIYYDIDMVNAHPTILQHLCKKLKQECKNLSLYINDRNKIINEILELNPFQTYDSIKESILGIINGGQSMFERLSKTKWLIDFKKEIDAIHNRFAEKFPEYLAKISFQRASKGKNYNHKASLMNHLLCNYENEYLKCMIDFLKKKKIIKNTFVCCFDGIMIPKEKVKDIGALLRELEKEIFTEYKIKIDLKIKEMIEFDMTGIPQTDDINTDNVDEKNNYTAVETDFGGGIMKDIMDIVINNLDYFPDYKDFNTLMPHMIMKTNIDSVKIIIERIRTDDDPTKSMVMLNVFLKELMNGSVPQIVENKNERENKEEVDHIHTSLLESTFLDGDIAEYFCTIHDNEFKWFSDSLYVYNGYFWEQSTTSIIYNNLDKMYFNLLKILNTEFRGGKYRKFYNDVITKKLIRLRTSKCLKNIWESIKFRIEIKEDIWDANPYLLGFKNGTYDLKQGIFRTSNKLDFISRVIPYEFKEVEQNELDFTMNYLNKILPIETEKDFFLKTLSTCLDGKLLENIIFALGNGRNGKDTILTVIMKNVLGENLYYDAPNHILTDKIKTGANPEVANMHKKRLIVYSEPDKNYTLKCATIKQLTGTEIMPVRGLYSSTNKTRMCGTHIVMQNKLLAMDCPDDAMMNRLFVIPFRAMFRTEEKLAELPEDTKFAYLVDSYFKSAEFIERIKLPLIHILLKYYKIFHNEGNILKNAPKSILEASKQYISDSDDFVNWFNECYERTDDEKEFIKLKDVYDKFKQSDLWINMTKNERRKMTRAKLEKDIIENPTLRVFFRDRKKINGVDYKSIMIKHKIKNYDNDNDNDDTDNDE